MYFPVPPTMCDMYFSRSHSTLEHLVLQHCKALRQFPQQLRPALNHRTLYPIAYYFAIPEPTGFIVHAVGVLAFR